MSSLTVARRCLLPLTAAILMSQSALAQLYVPSHQYPTIEDAVEKAGNGATIIIAPGTYVPAYTLNPLGKNLKFKGAVDGSGNPATVISGANVRPVFTLYSGETSQTSFENLVITRGYNGNGGGMFLEDASPVLINCVFVDNHARFYGGGAYVSFNSEPHFESCQFIFNDAGGTAGAVQNAHSSASYSNCLFHGNSSGGEGGAMRTMYGSVELWNCSFNQNEAGAVGGALQIGHSSALLTNCIFTNNESGSNGGAVFSDHSETAIRNCTLNGNSAEWRGGGLYSNNDVDITVENSSIANNFAKSNGGGFYNVLSEPVFISSNVNNNVSLMLGGGIYSAGGHLELKACDVSSNESTVSGGGLYIHEGDASLFGSAVQSNLAPVGGGITVGSISTLELTQSNVCDNSLTQIEGTWIDNGLNCVTQQCSSCACIADLNGDGEVNGTDLVQLLSGWGTPNGDLDGNGTVDSGDLTILLSTWGPCGP